jgi:hypothetical protein
MMICQSLIGLPVMLSGCLVFATHALRKNRLRVSDVKTTLLYSGGDLDVTYELEVLDMAQFYCGSFGMSALELGPDIDETCLN